MIILGIDPGLNGGAAVLETASTGTPRLVEAVDLPTVGEDAKRRIHVVEFSAWIKLHQPSHVFIERAQAMPDQGASSGFIYGRAVGALEATARLSGAELHTVEAAVWKRALHLPGGPANKDASRQRAIKLWPAMAETTFKFKKHEHRAEAALIACYGVLLVRP